VFACPPGMEAAFPGSGRFPARQVRDMLFQQPVISDRPGPVPARAGKPQDTCLARFNGACDGDAPSEPDDPQSGPDLGALAARVRCGTGMVGDRFQPPDIARSDKGRSLTDTPPVQQQVSLRLSGQNGRPFLQQTSPIFRVCRARQRSITSSGGPRGSGCASAASQVPASSSRSHRVMAAPRS
jgi:hypothetical protein